MMRPESSDQMKSRMLLRARDFLADCMIAPLKIPAKNGSSTDWPDAKTVSENRDLQASWADMANDDILVTGAIASTRAGIALYRVSDVTFNTASSLAQFLGHGWPDKVEEIERFDSLPLPLTRSLIRMLLGLSVQDITIMRALCAWRLGMKQDDLSSLMLREISVPGMNTKWIEKNAHLVLSVFSHAGWTTSDKGPLPERLGLEDPDRSQVSVRLSSAIAQRYRMWSRFSVPSTEFSSFSVSPAKVLIIENKTSFLRFPVNDDTAVLWGQGNAIIAMAKRMSWLNDVRDVLYWGDCDGAGYLILDRLRSVLPHARSINMTMREIEPHLGKAVPEKPGERVSADMPNLTKEESIARLFMHNNNLRLEQEFMI